MNERRKGKKCNEIFLPIKHCSKCTIKKRKRKTAPDPHPEILRRLVEYEKKKVIDIPKNQSIFLFYQKIMSKMLIYFPNSGLI
jgi:hypothetical protein